MYISEFLVPRIMKLICISIVSIPARGGVHVVSVVDLSTNHTDIITQYYKIV